MPKRDDLVPSVALPPGFDPQVILRAVGYIERELVDLVEVYLEQANVFSAIVGIYGVKALDSLSNWEKHKHTQTAQQRFPDLRRRGSGPNPAPNHCLESKGSKRPWALQSHYDHPGWYIVWRYLVDPTESIEPGRPVIVWRVDVAFLEKSDWKYEKSTADETGGGRTETFGIPNPATRFVNKAAYQRSDIVLRGGKPVPRNGIQH